MINNVLSPPRPGASPPVFDDPRGRRRRIMTAVGIGVCFLCLCVLAVFASLLYAAPNAPSTSPAEAAHTTPRR
ncbi:hypothetical protein [Streptomyces sp. TBY4]|uniref:hypothetical protein n=1 Tax=Streptomyces sp. TBY4 TaxID=2962030 RepID=UPI0020B74759|nr:hypothetical protein [Streptomyces sp. TBY4]MCP3759372.1 hypothetical protein [Streptomyces sp. TBY4]